MDTKVENYIRMQPEDRQGILMAIHVIIVKHDESVVPVVEPMMGKEMIIYKSKGMMKYGLASVKKYLTLHALPIYMSKPLSEKYQALLPKAVLQKGCINFNDTEEMPLDVAKQLISDCAKIDLFRIREELLKSRKEKKTAKK